MVQSIFSYIQPNIEGGKINKLKKLLTELGLYETFIELQNDYGNDWEKVATFIIFCYCQDSSFVLANTDWTSTKQGIFDLVGLRETEHTDVLSFKKQSVKDAIRMVGEVKNDWRHYHLIMWKESTSLLDAIAVTEPNEKQKTPAKNIADAAKYSYELKLKIADLEKNILQTSKSPERQKETSDIELENLSYEKILKNINKN